VSAVNLQECVHRACLLEATSRKPGNVHPGASFEHVDYRDFVASAEAIAPVLAQTASVGVGQSILEAVTATRQVCQKNTNLGIILLLAPLTAVPQSVPLLHGIPFVLSRLTQQDAECVFEAIRLAQPRGLGSAESEDVSTTSPTGTLIEVMSLAADRDAIARQYVSDFDTVIGRAVSILLSPGQFEGDWEQAIIHLHLNLLAIDGDTDIARKCGAAAARECQQRAKAVLQAGWPMDGRLQFREFDSWLRAHGSQRNPGTTADLVTAGVFSILRDQQVPMPSLEDIRARAEKNKTAQL